MLTHHFNWKRLSMAAALAYTPRPNPNATLVFSMQPGSYNDESLVVFLSELHGLLEGNKATVICRRALLASQRQDEGFRQKSATLARY